MTSCFKVDSNGTCYDENGNIVSPTVKAPHVSTCYYLCFGCVGNGYSECIACRGNRKLKKINGYDFGSCECDLNEKDDLTSTCKSKIKYLNYIKII